jgi:Fe-S cluster biogenesis protein NfuA
MATVPVEINLEFTPNPNTLKYTLNRRVLLNGAENFTSREEAEPHSPLATKLFDVDDVCGIMIGPTFITVTLASQDNLRELNRTVMTTIKEHLESGDVIVTPRDPETLKANESETAKRIREILDAEVRPAVAQDGGDITFERYDENSGVVYLYMMGACSGCPSSQMTLKSGIETRLRQEFPEITDVVPI